MAYRSNAREGAITLLLSLLLWGGLLGATLTTGHLLARSIAASHAEHAEGAHE